MSKCVSRSYTILALLIVFSLLPIFPHPSAVAATLSPTLTESTDGHALALHLSASQSSASQSAASLPMQGLLKYGTDAEALFSVLAVGTVQAIHITDTGFNPAELSVFGPTDVTWINETTITQTLQSGIPITTSTGNNIYLPVVQRGGAASFAAAANYLDLLMQQAMSEPTFSAILPPGQSFRYRYLKPGLYQYHLSSAPQFKGEVNLSGVALLRANPSNGENDVAVTRETILEFSDALDATTVTAAAFAVTAGNTSLDYRLNLSADKSRVTLFYKDALPGSVRVRVMVDGSQLKDGKGLAVDVNGDGVAGGTQVIEFDTLSLTILPGTSVCGRVFASELAVNASNVSVNTPLKGATVTVDGMEDALRTTSDDNGNFCLDPAPVGRFFVHIDGRSVTTDVPAGTYYPFVGKAWQSVAGQQTNVGDVFLPLIPAGTLQSVSADQNTQITFPDTVVQQHPELLGVSIVVPADSLYSDDGSRGGKVGIAPVPPDRLPGPLPPGLNFPVVITVQTDGAGNFDQPAPVCFPNLPDKDTGQPLPAGSKSALWSFNHDTGRFEIVGPMTVSADGKLACTDAGVGIKAPGWHGTQPGTPTEPCKLTKEDWINIAVDVGTAAVGCLSALTGVDNFIENVFKLSKEGRALLNNLESLYEASVNGSMTVVQIREYMKVIVSAKSVLEAATEALKKSAPTEKVLAALQCAESVLDGLIGVCDTVTKKGDQCISTWVKFTCNGLDVVRLIIARINSLSGAVEKGLAKLSLTVLCKTLDEMAKLLGIASGSVDAMALPLGDNEPVQPEILAEMQKAIVETNLFLADLIVIEDYAEELQQLAQEMETIHYQSELLNQPNPGFPINSYYLVEYTEFAVHGKSNDRGDFTAIIRPGTDYTFGIYDPATHRLGKAIAKSTLAGQSTMIPMPDFTGAFDLTDSDGDGLTDRIEDVIDTDRNKVDSDGDSINDKIEVDNGTDPLDGLPVRTGIISTADTPGTAVDLCVQNNLATVADSQAGVAFFNVFDVSNPLLVAQVDTPGNATRVACINNRIAVADGSSGLAILDISNLATARIVHQLNLNTNATAVATVGQLVYVGGEDKQVVVVDLLTGANLGQVTVDGTVQDLVINGDYLYVLTAAKLYTFAIVNTTLILQNSVASPGITGGGGRLWRLFVGGSLAYATHSKGYNTFDLSQPEQPILIATGNTAQFGWKQLVSNGSGVGVAAVGANRTNDGAHDISIYDISNSTKTDEFITTFCNHTEKMFGNMKE